AQALTPGRSYSWAYGVVTTTRTFWSVAQSFSIAPLARPSATGPAGGIATNQPTFTWTSVNGADHYDLVLDDVTADDIQVLHTTGNGTSLTLNASQALVFGDSYTWQVRAVSVNGRAVSPPSRLQNVFVAAPTPQGPMGGITIGTQTPSFGWAPITGA